MVAQHLVFFRQGAALLGRMEGPYSDAMAIVEHLRKEGQAKQVRACVGCGNQQLGGMYVVLLLVGAAQRMQFACRASVRELAGGRGHRRWPYRRTSI